MNGTVEVQYKPASPYFSCVQKYSILKISIFALGIIFFGLGAFFYFGSFDLMPTLFATARERIITTSLMGVGLLIDSCVLMSCVTPSKKLRTLYDKVISDKFQSEFTRQIDKLSNAQPNQKLDVISEIEDFFYKTCFNELKVSPDRAEGYKNVLLAVESVLAPLTDQAVLPVDQVSDSYFSYARKHLFSQQTHEQIAKTFAQTMTMNLMDTVDIPKTLALNLVSCFELMSPPPDGSK